MKTTIKILLFMIMTIGLVSCSSDNDTDDVADDNKESPSSSGNGKLISSIVEYEFSYNDSYPSLKRSFDISYDKNGRAVKVVYSNQYSLPGTTYVYEIEYSTKEITIFTKTPNPYGGYDDFTPRKYSVTNMGYCIDDNIIYDDEGYLIRMNYEGTLKIYSTFSYGTPKNLVSYWNGHPGKRGNVTLIEEEYSYFLDELNDANLDLNALFDAAFHVGLIERMVGLFGKRSPNFFHQRLKGKIGIEIGYNVEKITRDGKGRIVRIDTSWSSNRNVTHYIEIKY